MKCLKANFNALFSRPLLWISNPLTRLEQGSSKFVSLLRRFFNVLCTATIDWSTFSLSSCRESLSTWARRSCIRLSFSLPALRAKISWHLGSSRLIWACNFSQKQRICLKIATWWLKMSLNKELLLSTPASKRSKAIKCVRNTSRVSPSKRLKILARHLAKIPSNSLRVCSFVAI